MNDNTIIELEALKVEALVIGYPSDEPICAEYRAIAAKIRALKQDETQPPTESPERRECYTVWSQEGRLILAEATKKSVRRLTTMILLDSDITRMVELRPGERIVSRIRCRTADHTELLRRAHKTLSHIAEHCSQDGMRRMAAGDAEHIAAALELLDSPG
jgi:hypothetical protein